MKKLLVLLGVAIAIALIAYSQRATIVSGLAERVLEARMGANHMATLEDGLHLALCGAGSPLAAPNTLARVSL